MGSTDFNGTTSRISIVNDAITSGPITAITWARWDTSGEGTVGCLIGDGAFQFQMAGTSTQLWASYDFNTTDASSVTAALFTTGVWYCVAATFDNSGDNKLRIYWGTEYLPMREVSSYSSQTAGVGNPATTQTTHFAGDWQGVDRSFDGRLLHPVKMNYLLTLDEMERWRKGDLTVPFKRGIPHMYFTLDNASTVDASRRASAGTISATALTASSEMPAGIQFAWDWARGHPLRRTVAAAASEYPLNETFDGASGAPNARWTTSVVAGGTVELDTDRLKMTVTAQNDAAQALLADIVPADLVDLRASYTFTTNTAQNNGFNFRGDGVWQGSGNRHLFTNGLALAPLTNVDQVRLYSTVASVSTQLGSSLSLTIGATDTVNMRVSLSGTSVFWKAWIDGTLEPTEWQTATDSDHSARTRLGLAVHDPLTSNPVTMYWDNVVANDVPAGPTSPVLPLVTSAQTVFAPTVTLSTTSFTETWTGTNGDPWPAQWTTQATGTGTVADIQSNKGRMATGTGVYGKIGARNSAAYLYSNYTLQVDITVPTYTEWYFFVHLHGANSFANTYALPSSYQIRFTQFAATIVCEMYQVDASGAETLRSTGVVSGTPVAGDTIRIMIQVAGTSSITLLQKAWKVGTSEPAYTAMSGDVSVAYTGSHFALSAQGGNNTTSEDFLWDDFSVTASTQTAVLPLVTSTQTLFGPTVTRGSVTAVLPLVTNTPTVFSPTITTGALSTVLPLVTSPQTLFSPSVAVGSVSVVLPLVTSAPTVFSPAALPTLYPILPLVTSPQTVFEATISSGSAVATLPLVTNTPTVFSPSVSATTQTVVLPMVYASTTGALLDSNGQAILDSNGLPLLDGLYGVFAPAAALGTPIATLPIVSSPQTVFSPSIRGTQAIVTPLVTSPQTVLAPGLLITLIELPLVTSAQTVLAPAVFLTLYPVLPLVTSPQTVFSPSASYATYTIVMDRVLNPPTVFDPAVSSSSTTVELPLIINLLVVFAPGLRYGVYTFEPPRDENGPRKLSETGRRRQGVSRSANDLAGLYGAPRSFSVLKLNGVYVQIEGPDMDQVNAATEYYAGGHIHEVTVTQALALQAAGFDVDGI